MKNNISDLMDSLLRYLSMKNYRSATPLPSIRFLSEWFNVNTYQMVSALKLLEKRGLIYRQTHKGFFYQETGARKYDKNISRIVFIGNLPDSWFDLNHSMLTKYYVRLAKIYHLSMETIPDVDSEQAERRILLELLDKPDTAAIFIKATYPGNSDLISDAITAGRKWLFTAGVPPYEQIVPYFGTDDYMIGGYAGKLLARCRHTPSSLYIGYDPASSQMAANRRQGVINRLNREAGQHFEEILFTRRVAEDANRLRDFLEDNRQRCYKIFTASQYFTEQLLQAIPGWQVNRDYYLVGMDYYGQVNGQPVTGVYRSKELEAKLAIDWIVKAGDDANIMQIFLKPLVTIGNTIALD